ncbi:MAG: hypothetical protein FD164_1511 [Nitrospirae bacterium]|nr:MAG: hypothetical protein FD164_1511 [Nitrospirota bacterium]
MAPGCSGAELPGHTPTGFLLNNAVLFDACILPDVLASKLGIIAMKKKRRPAGCA